MTAIDDRIAEIEAADPAPESLRERVARALWIKDGDSVRWEAVARDSWLRRQYLGYADVAIAVITTPWIGYATGGLVPPGTSPVLDTTCYYPLPTRPALEPAPPDGEAKS